MKDKKKKNDKKKKTRKKKKGKTGKRKNIGKTKIKKKIEKYIRLKKNRKRHKRFKFLFRVATLSNLPGVYARRRFFLRTCISDFVLSSGGDVPQEWICHIFGTINLNLFCIIV